MLTNEIIKLQLAFADLPFKGLFFWEGLLTFTEEEYQQLIEAELSLAINSMAKNSPLNYHEILEDLRAVRDEITVNPSIRNEIEKIRETLIEQTAAETIMTHLRDKMA